MTSTLDDLREVLADRAAVTPGEAAAARARFDLHRAGPPRRPRRPRRHARVLAVATVALAAVTLVAGVVAVTGPRGSTGATGPAAAGSLPLTDWLFTVRTETLPADLDVVQYGHADRNVQTAFILRPGDAATSDHHTALVQLVTGTVDRPRGAASEAGGWSAPSDQSIEGWQVVWTDSANHTLRAVAPDLATARLLRSATEVGVTHPVRFPMAVGPGALPAGSRVESVDFVGTQGIEARISVPGSPMWRVDVAAPGVYLGNQRGGVGLTVTPFTAGFSRVTSDALDATSAVVTSTSADLLVIIGDPSDPARPAVTDDDLRALVTGARYAPFALHPDQEAWFPLADALPVG